MQSSAAHPQTPLVVTTGEPAGIGMDVVLKSFNTLKLGRPMRVLADPDALTERARMLGVSLKLHEGAAPPTDPAKLWIEPVFAAQKVTPGVLAAANSSMVLEQLCRAHEQVSSKRGAALVTAPLHKAVINEAVQLGLITSPNHLNGLTHNFFSGHTEYFATLSGSQKVVMMLANSKAKVALVTTHVPLSQVPKLITASELKSTLNIIIDEFQSKFGLKQPKLKVCGLNPHAGENGHLGKEELEVIEPALKQYQDSLACVQGPFAADTLFTPKNLESTDVFVAMYHDQGLVAVKTLGFGDTVNVTLGLPYVRTSVDHGTALDLAGTNQISASSFEAALRLADTLSTGKP